jgi:hypothetical protein
LPGGISANMSTGHLDTLGNIHYFCCIEANWAIKNELKIKKNYCVKNDNMELVFLKKKSSTNLFKKYRSNYFSISAK